LLSLNIRLLPLDAAIESMPDTVIFNAGELYCPDEGFIATADIFTALVASALLVILTDDDALFAAVSLLVNGILSFWG
jgi:hypothetical protein